MLTVKSATPIVNRRGRGHLYFNDETRIMNNDNPNAVFEWRQYRVGTGIVVVLWAVMVLTGCGSEAGGLADDFDGNDNADGGDVAHHQDALTICQSDADCGSDEACTQGGHCVNITGSEDATSVLQAELDDLDEAVGMGVPYRLPDNAILQINDLDGDGIGLNVPTQVIFEGSGSVLDVENDVTGLRIDQDADFSMVRDLEIRPQDMSLDTPHDGIGVDIRAHGTRLDNLYIERMGTGIRAPTNADGEFSNVNKQQWSRIVLRLNHHAGAALSGADSNGGLMTGFEVRGGAGIDDNSFLGNTYVGNSFEGTDDLSLELGSNAGRHTVVGTYLELSDPDITGASNVDVFVGGNAIDRIDTSGDRVGMQSGRIRFEDPYSDGVEVKIPGHDDSPIGFKHPDEDHWWYLRYFDNTGYKTWAFAYGNTGTVPFSWTAVTHPDGPALFDMGDTLD